MRPIGIAIFVCALLVIGIALAVGDVLSRPAARVIGAPPDDLGASVVRIARSPEGFVSGWFARGSSGSGAVLLLHGVRADRTQMLARARMLRKAGYSVLLIDLPAHGESSGERIGFGVTEAEGVAAALAFLRRELPAERIGVIGVSLGAAALVLSRPRPAPDAVVLESMYPTIDEAVSNRLAMRFGAAGSALSPLLLWQLPWRLGVGADRLRPVSAIGDLNAPLLIASGTHDRHTTWDETRRIHAAAHPRSELWAVEGAAHVDLHAFAPQAYQARVFNFLARHLRRAG